jgi:ABC-type oligopeptide transport system substrate-binding subunit
MKKILVALLVVFLGVAMLTSCGEKKEEAVTTDPAATEATTTDPATTDATTTDPATTDTTTQPAAEGVMEINELTLTPAAGWKGEAMKESGMITLSTESGSAFTLIAVENFGSLTLDAYVTAQKDTLKSFGEIKEDKATYGGLEYSKLEYSIGGNPIYQLNGLTKNFFVMVTINGGMTPEVESMLNSIVIK